MNFLPAIEIYAIGTELLMGQIQEENSHWMCREIATLGGHVRRTGIIDDDLAEVAAVLSDAISRKTHMIITSGGLGPTPDDLTVSAMAQVLGVNQVVDEKLIRHFMCSRQITHRNQISPALIKMATIPKGSHACVNPAGVAPCIKSRYNDTTIFNIPGPPREVKAVFPEYLVGPIGDLYGGTRASVRVIVNLPESECGPILQRVMTEHPDTYLKAFVALSEKTQDGQRLPVDIVTRADDQDSARALLEQTLTTFTEIARDKGSKVTKLETE